MLCLLNEGGKMITIMTYDFSEEGKKRLGLEEKGKNWPVVYMLYNDGTLYIGETSSVYHRIGNHLKDDKKTNANIKKFKVIFDDTFNKSVVLDYEQKMIKWCKADGKFKNVLNANDGQKDAHEYYERRKYESYFKDHIWPELKKENMVIKDVNDIVNENLFKYSPYTSLTGEQKDYENDILKDIFDCLEKIGQGISIINGGAGTGKTVMAIHMIYRLLHLDEKYMKDYVNRFGKLRIGLLFPMTGIRGVIEDVFKRNGDLLQKELIINPYMLERTNTFKKYDIIFVDESHRLKKRKNLSSGPEYARFDEVCRSLKMDKSECNQLDWVLEQAKYKVLFYDKDQSIKSSDITYTEYQNSLKKYNYNKKSYDLTTQMRCEGGEEYIRYIKDILNCEKEIEFKNICNYDFRYFEDADSMIDRIRKFDDEMSLCKTVAGNSWPWITKPNKKPLDNMDYYNEMVQKGKYDIYDIGKKKYIWNFVTDNWIIRKDSHVTIGCIHSTQGIDMNYVGVIFGREIDYDPQNNRIVIKKEFFEDTKVKAGVKDINVIKEYIINTYTTMMARGIKGCYVYAYHDNLKNYLKQFIRNDR